VVRSGCSPQHSIPSCKEEISGLVLIHWIKRSFRNCKASLTCTRNEVAALRVVWQVLETALNSRRSLFKFIQTGHPGIRIDHFTPHTPQLYSCLLTNLLSVFQRYSFLRHLSHPGYRHLRHVYISRPEGTESRETPAGSWLLPRPPGGSGGRLPGTPGFYSSPHSPTSQRTFENSLGL